MVVSPTEKVGFSISVFPSAQEYRYRYRSNGGGMTTPLIRGIFGAILAPGFIRLYAQDAEKRSAADDLAFLQQAFTARTQPDAEQWRQRVEARLSDLSADLDQLIAGDQGERALQFAVPFAYFLAHANQQKRALEVLTRALQSPSAQAATSARANALYDAGLLAFRQRDQGRSRALNEESLRIAREIGDDAAAATALIGLSRIALREHDYKTVKKYAQEAADIRHKLGNEAGSTSAMHIVAAALRMEGNDGQAEKFYESTLATYRAAGDKSRVAGEQYNLGCVYIHQNRLAKALKMFTTAMHEYRAENDEAGIAYCLNGFAAVAAVEKEPVRAAKLYGAAAAILERLGITLDPDDQLDWDRYTDMARRQTKRVRFDREFELGRALTIEQAVAIAMR